MDTRIMLVFALVIAASGCISQSSVDAPQTQDSEKQPENPQPEPEKTDSPRESNNATESSNTVYFTGSGFTPSKITVESGETVTWINNASTTMWVGSNRHPTHTEYDGTSLRQHCGSGSDTFDQCGTGDRYSFTFEKEGTWGYHNHDPYVSGGEVVVE